jgi:hypothetical protein
MFWGFVAAICVVVVPALALGTALAPACGDDDAAWALGPIAALAVMVFASETVTELGQGGWLLTMTPVSLGVIGLVICIRRRLSARWLLPPALSVGGALAILAWPYYYVHAGVLGWNVANDSVVHAIESTYIAQGRPAQVPGSAFGSVAESQYNGGYPHGAHELVAAVITPGGNALHTYDPAMAAMVSLGALAGYWVLRRSGLHIGLAVFGGVVAAAGFLQFEWYAQGFLPQMASTPFIFGAIGLAYEAARSGRIRTALLAGAATGGAIATYSAGTAVYIALAFLACAAGSVVARHRRDGLRVLALQAVAVAVGGVVILAPTLRATVDFIRASSQVYNGGSAGFSVGQLPHPVSPTQALGPWIGPDFRVPYLEVRPTEAAQLAAIALLGIAIVLCLRRRRFALPVMLASTAFAAFYVTHRSDAYYAAKSYQVLAFPVACAVVAGAGLAIERLNGRALLVVGVPVVLLLGGWTIAVERSLHMVVQNQQVTPTSIGELAAIGRRLGHVEGLALVPDDWAKWALPTASSPYDQSVRGRVFKTLPGADEQGWFDFDDFDPAETRSVRYIVETRLGDLSIPPPPFRLVSTTDDFLVYERPAGAEPSPHRIPLEPPGRLGGATLAASAHFRLPLSGDVLLGVEPRDSILFSLSTWDVTNTAWAHWSADPRYIVSTAHGQGPARHTFDLGATGRYRVLLNGQASADMTIRIDGRALPNPRAGGLSTLQSVGLLSLTAGMHTVELEAGPASLSYLKALAIDREGGPQPTGALCVGDRRYQARADRPLTLHLTGSTRTITNCGAGTLRLDWIEPA